MARLWLDEPDESYERPKDECLLWTLFYAFVLIACGIIGAAIIVGGLLQGVL